MNGNKQNLVNDLRIVGVGSMVLMALAMALPWVTVSMPLMGSIGVSGYKSGGDGWLFLAVVVATGVFAFLRYRRTTGYLSAVLILGLIGEYVYAAVSIKGEMSGETDEFSKALADSVSIQPGMGLILGVLIAGALATYALWLQPRLEQGEATEATPEITTSVV